jgi:chromosome segregation ATPase
MQKLDEALRTVNTQVDRIDWEELQKQINNSMEKVNREIKDQQIDMEQLKKKINETVNSIDLDKIKEETARAMQHVKADVDLNTMNEEIQRALSNVEKQINGDELRKRIDEATSVNMDQMKKAVNEAGEAIRSNKYRMKDEIQKAKERIKSTKAELKNYKQMLEEMQGDGLVDTKKDYSVEYNDGELFINDQRQPANVLEKYKGFFKSDHTKIYKTNGEFNIDID